MISTSLENQAITGYRLTIVSILAGLVFFLISAPAFTKELPEEDELQPDFPRGVKVEYNAGNFRDPLRPQIFLPEEEKPEAAQAPTEKKPKISEVLSLSLQGIIWNPEAPLAIINNRVFKKGEVLRVIKDEKTTAEVTIKEINKDGVTIIYSGEMEDLFSPAKSELQRIKGGKK